MSINPIVMRPGSVDQGEADESSRARITLTIGTFNRAALLSDALASIEEQDLDRDAWSVLVVDNNSEDDTEAVVRTYVERGLLPRARYIKECRQGISYCRQRAILESDTELIAFVDDDCLLQSDWLRQAVGFCEAHPRAGAVGGRVDLLWESPPTEVSLARAASLAAQHHGDAPCRLPSTGPTYLVGAGLVVRRTAVLQSGWIDSWLMVGRRGASLSGGSDVELVLRIRRAGYELWYNPAMKLQHRIPQHRTTVRYLCRLNRTQRREVPILRMLADGRIPSRKERVEALLHETFHLLRTFGNVIVTDMLVGRRLPSEDRMVRLCAVWGNVEGALLHVFSRSEM